MKLAHLQHPRTPLAAKLSLFGVLAAYLLPLLYYETMRATGNLPREVSEVTGHGPWYYGPEANVIGIFLLAQALLLLITVAGSIAAAVRSHSPKPLLSGGVLLITQAALLVFADGRWLWTL